MGSFHCWLCVRWEGEGEQKSSFWIFPSLGFSPLYGYSPEQPRSRYLHRPQENAAHVRPVSGAPAIPPETGWTGKSPPPHSALGPRLRPWGCSLSPLPSLPTSLCLGQCRQMPVVLPGRRISSLLGRPHKSVFGRCRT